MRTVGYVQLKPEDVVTKAPKEEVPEVAEETAEEAPAKEEKTKKAKTKE